jgi:hypothetical protein
VARKELRKYRNFQGLVGEKNFWKNLEFFNFLGKQKKSQKRKQK